MIQAKETNYNHLCFRSRIEARWAFVFDLLGVKYEYEKETVVLPSGSYLPDFWLPVLKSWVEIKGIEPNDRERTLARQLADAAQCRVIIFFGEIPIGESTQESARVYWQDGADDSAYSICECPNCGFVGIEFNGRSDRLACKSDGCPTYARNGDKTYTGNSDRIQTAYSMARRARFEWGETPKAHLLPFYPYPPERTTFDWDALELPSSPLPVHQNIMEVPF